MNHIKYTQNLSAFILAAGLGERLLPITHHIPKPLLPILGKPVLQSVIKRLIALPINNIGINLHHKKQIIEDWIKQSEYFENITLFPEDPLLGTGGALKNAEDFLYIGPFIVHNADILSDMDLGKLVAYHNSSGNIATLAVHDYPEFNRLILDRDGFLKNIVKHPHPYPPPSRGSESSGIFSFWSTNPPLNSSTSTSEMGSVYCPPSSGGRGLGGGGTESIKLLAFTGIAVYQPEFLQFLPEGNSSVVDAWFNAISAGNSIGTMDVTGSYWTDIGTPSSYAQAVIGAMRGNGENVFIDQSVTGCTGAELDGYVVIEKENVIHKGVTLRNCVSLPGTIIGKTSEDESTPECFLSLFWGSPDSARTQKVFENCLLGPDLIVKLSESDFYETDDHGQFVIGTGGSDRKYCRVKKNDHSAVLMHCAENDPDFNRHIEYTTFFRTYAVPVPELITADPHTKTAFFEDLGDLSLYSWLKCPRSGHQLEEMYQRVLDILIPMHTVATAHVHECPLFQSRIFDYAYLRWETGYFLERFVEGVKHIELKDRETIEHEFHTLASTVDALPKTIIHRDFQSQNIMITKGGIPRMLDYQGARIAPPAYDVVSLLWDPYYRLEDSLREKLLDYYIYKVIPPHPPLEKGGNNFSNTKETSIRDKFSPFTKRGSKGITHLHGKNTAASKYPPFAKGGLRGITEDELRATLLPCRLQRHMQALGAYGFLTTVKGKRYFQNYIPEGIRLLKEDVSESGNDYPALHKLVMGL